MEMLRKKYLLFIKANIIFGVFVFLILASPVFATPPDSPYYPGETDNPACSPTSTNCKVSASLPTTLSTSTVVDLNTHDITFSNGNLRVIGNSYFNTIASGTWNGNAITDSYISSATNWNNIYNIVNASSSNWTSAYNTVTASSSFWNTAYSWGDHASAGYLTNADLSSYLTTSTAASTYLSLSVWTITTTLPNNIVLSNLTQVGTITTGTWNGTVVGTGFGGTGTTTLGAAGTLAYSNGSSYAFTTSDNSSGGLYWDSTNSRLGIGTSTTNSSLQLNTGTIRMGSTKEQFDLKNIPLTGVAIFDVVAQGTASQAFRIIPGSAPGYNYLGQNQATFFEFHRNNAQTDRLLLTAPSTAANGYNFVSYLTSGGTPGPITFGYTTSASTSTETMRITGSGRVGIGTVSPTEKFEVTGNSILGGGVTTTGNLNVLGSSYFNTISSGTWQGTAISDGYISSAANWNTAYNDVNVSSSYWNSAYLWGNHASAGYLSTTTAASTYLSLAIWNTTTTLPSSILLSSLTQVGTISTGTWNGTMIGTSFGGTGTTTLGAAGTLAYSNGTGYAFTGATQLYWNSASGTLGIGTSSPSETLDVLGSITLNNGGSYKGRNSTGASFDMIKFGTGNFGLANAVANSFIIAPASGGNAWQLGFSTSGITGNFGSTGKNLSFFASSSEQMRIISTGVGIGTTAPTSRLEVYDAVNSSVLTITSASSSTAVDPYIAFRTGATPATNFVMGVDASDSNKFKISSSTGIGTTDFLTITNAGKVGVNTSTPVDALSIGGSLPMLRIGDDNASASWNIKMGIVTTTNYGAGIWMGQATPSVTNFAFQAEGNDIHFNASAAAGNTYFRAGNSNKMTILGTSGNVGIATITPAFKLQVYLSGSAEGHVASDGTWANTSDARLKKNINDVGGALDKVMLLRAVTYDPISLTYNSPSGTNIGFLAQEVEKILPEAVDTSPVTGFKAISYSKFAPLLAAAIKEQQGTINSLNLSASTTATMIANHEARIKSLEESVATLQQTNTSTPIDLTSLNYGNISANSANVLTLTADSLLVRGSTELQGKLVVAGQIKLGADSVGKATIVSGATSTLITFSAPYETVPVITITPLQRMFGIDYWVEQVSSTGFAVAVDASSPQFSNLQFPLSFDWHAFASNENFVVSVASESTPVSEVAAAPASVPAVPVETPAEITPVVETSTPATLVEPPAAVAPALEPVPIETPAETPPAPAEAPLAPVFEAPPAPAPDSPSI